jgi:hypothetical protein
LDSLLVRLSPLATLAIKLFSSVIPERPSAQN